MKQQYIRNNINEKLKPAGKMTIDLPTLNLILHCGTTLMMTGIIWFVQVVHYPLFSEVGAAGFTVYEAKHTKRTGWVVAPLMTVELASGIALLWYLPPSTPLPLAQAGLFLLILIWASTMLLQVPLHRRLVKGFDAAAHRKLVRSNWLRTLAWSGRTVLLYGMIFSG